MQGHRNSIGSSTEVLNFDHGSSSSNSDLEQQMFWNNMTIHEEDELSDLILPSETTVHSSLDFVGLERSSFNTIWDLGESSSSNAQNEPDSLFFPDNVNASTNQSLNNESLFMQISNGDVSPLNLNLNAGNGRSSSNKRRTMEENSGQSSNNGGNLNINDTGPSPLEHVAVSYNRQRNVRARINPTSLQDFMPINLNSSSTQNLDLNSALLEDFTRPQINPSATYVSAPLQNVQATSSSVPVEINEAPRDEGIMRNIRHIVELPVFEPGTASGMRDLAQIPRFRHVSTRRVDRNGASSSSRSGPSSGANSRPLNRNHSSQIRRRLSELIHLSLMSSDTGGPVGTHSTTLDLNASGSSQEAVASNGASNEGNRHTYHRSLLWMERYDERRGRLVSEIRNMLNVMRREEGIRLEDAMVLEHPLLSGAADGHDRHRDMRLDVDNMSYEELLELEERMGDVNTGLSVETISNCLKQRKYVSIEIESQFEAEPCSICREEYNDDEDLGILECGHDFHTDCIKQWLVLKNLCPICKTSAMANTQKA